MHEYDYQNSTIFDHNLNCDDELYIKNYLNNLISGIQVQISD